MMADTNYQDILVETRSGGVGLITLNRPEALNAYNIQMRDDLYEVLSAIKDDSEVNVVIVIRVARQSYREGHFGRPGRTRKCRVNGLYATVVGARPQPAELASIGTVFRLGAGGASRGPAAAPGDGHGHTCPIQDPNDDHRPDAGAFLLPVRV